MKFQCDQQQMIQALNIVSKAVSVRTTIPTLKGILLEKDPNGNLLMTASDMDLTIQYSFPVDTKGEPFEGREVVPARLFADIVRKLPKGELSFQSENGKAIIKSINSEFTIVTMPADEFPNIINTEENEETVPINKELFCDMIRKTSFAASIDQTKGVINGVLIELLPEEMRTVAIDGYRMAVCRTETINEKEKKVIISASILNELVKLLSDVHSEEEKVRFATDNKSAVLYYGGVKVMMRLIGGEFIKYNDILPKEFSIDVKVKRTDLINSVERASLLSREGKNNLIKLAVTDKLITITSQSEEGAVKEDLFCDKQGNDLTIGFNARYVLDMLRAIEDDTILLRMNSPITPCLALPLQGDAYQYLLLPVRITNM